MDKALYRAAQLKVQELSQSELSQFDVKFVDFEDFEPEWRKVNTVSLQTWVTVTQHIQQFESRSDQSRPHIKIKTLDNTKIEVSVVLKEDGKIEMTLSGLTAQRAVGTMATMRTHLAKESQRNWEL